MQMHKVHIHAVGFGRYYYGQTNYLHIFTIQKYLIFNWRGVGGGRLWKGCWGGQFRGCLGGGRGE